MSTITKEKLLEKLVNQPATIVSLYADTEPKMLAKHPKTGQPNPYKGRIRKQAKVNGIINFHYERVVNNRRIKEEHGEVFEVAPRQWGERIDGTALVEHKGDFYLEIMVEHCLERLFLVDGNPAPDDVKDYMPKRKEGTRQELEKPVILRDYKIDNIRALVINGEQLLVEQE